MTAKGPITTATVRLLSPIGVAAQASRADIAQRTGGSGPYRLGFLDSTRPGSDLMLARLEELLAERVGVGTAVRRRKKQSATVAPFLDDFAGCDGVVAGIAEIGGSLFGTAMDALELERRGIPVALLVSAEVADACRLLLARHGMPGIPLVELEPTAEAGRDTVLRVAESGVDGVMHVLTARREDLAGDAEAAVGRAAARELAECGPDSIEIPDRVAEVARANDLLYRHGWTDGLPVLPPTEAAVAEMLAHTDLDPGESLGVLAPRQGVATVAKVAVNAVLAGCPPKLFPLVVAATRAVSDPDFRLGSVQTTTNPASPLVIVNGPLATALDVNAGRNAFGQGHRANATLGRALRLVLVNIGGARPGIEDRAVQGTPGKYSFCVAENEARSPWEPLHVERGFPAGTSTVTVVGTESQHNINDHVHTDAEGILRTVADAMSTIATNNIYKHNGEVVVALAPYHAATIAADGWRKRDVRRFLFEHARRPIRDLRRGGQWGLSSWAPWLATDDETATVPVVGDPADFLIVVVGGEGKHSSWIPTFGMTRAVTVPVQPA
ncbi:UGSC family (seleno)protein [Actinophytocola sp.]|uniref:UGSC family (seleno)protein n=1 Tax=Actinophytocola sp. TaxID=1872138 RepID=UPI003D6BE2A9